MRKSIELLKKIATPYRVAGDIRLRWGLFTDLTVYLVAALLRWSTKCPIM